MIQTYLQATGYCWFKPFAWCFRCSFSDPKPRARNSVGPVTAVRLWSLCHASECCFVNITCMYTHINTGTLWLSDITVHYVTVSGHRGHRCLILSDKRSLLVFSDQWFHFLTHSCTVSHSDMQLISQLVNVRDTIPKFLNPSSNLIWHSDGIRLVRNRVKHGISHCKQRQIIQLPNYLSLLQVISQSGCETLIVSWIKDSPHHINLKECSFRENSLSAWLVTVVNASVKDTLKKNHHI